MHVDMPAQCVVNSGVPVHAYHMQTIVTSSTVVLFHHVLCALTSRQQFVSNKFIAQKSVNACDVGTGLASILKFKLVFMLCVCTCVRKNRACHFVPCLAQDLQNYKNKTTIYHLSF